MRVLVAFSFFVFSVTAFSQTVETGRWSLQQCIDYALEHNLAVQQQRLSTDLSAESKVAADNAWLPSLNAGASHAYNFGQTIDRFTNQFATQMVQSNNFFIGANMPLFNGFEIKYNKEQAAVNYAAALKDVEVTENNIVLQVSNAFLQILFANEILAAAEQQAQLSSEQLEQTQKLVKAGVQPVSAQYEIEAQLATENLRVTEARNQVTLSELALKQLLQLEASSAFEIDVPSITEASISNGLSTAGTIYDAALTAMPEIQSSELKLEASTLTEQIAKARYYPSLSFSASAGTGYSGLRKEVISSTLDGATEFGFTNAGEIVYVPNYNVVTQTVGFGSQLADNLNQTISVSLSVPIFNRFSTRTSVNRARINAEIAELEVERTKNQLRQDVEQAYADALAAKQSFESTKTVVDARTKAFEFAQTRFKAGASNSLEFNTAKNQLAQSQSDLIRAKYNALFRLKVLDFYQGKPIVF